MVFFSLFFAFVLGWFFTGALRGIAGIGLNHHLANAMPNLALEEVAKGFFAPDFLMYVLGAAALGTLVAALVSRAHVGTSRPSKVVAAGVALSVFFLVLALHEITTKTAMRDTFSGRLVLSPAHVVILALAAAGTLLCVLSFRASTGMTSLRSAMYAVFVVALVTLSTTVAGMANERALAAATPARNIVLITIDTLRADHLSCYGYGRETTPRIDRLAAEGVLYERALSQAPNTHPSMGSMTISELPSRLSDPYFKYIPYSLPTLAEAFKNAGYHTAGVVSNVWLKSGLGFDQGFDDYDQTSAMSEFYSDRARVGWKNAADVSRAAIAWLDANANGEPFFLWLHYLDPHHPYDAPTPFDTYYGLDKPEAASFLGELRRMQTGDLTRLMTRIGSGEVEVTPVQFDAIVAAYDAEIRFTDAEIGRVLDSLRDHGLLDRTVIALTADHGEEFRDHGGWGHAHTLYNELLHVPLVVRYPDGPRGQREGAPVAVLDVAPTLLASAGIPVPKSMLGRDLRRTDPKREIASTLTRKGIYSVQNRDWKLIAGEDYDTALFHLADDPLERVNVARSVPKQTEQMLASLRAAVGSEVKTQAEASAAGTLDAASREQLRALGYLE